MERKKREDMLKELKNIVDKEVIDLNKVLKNVGIFLIVIIIVISTSYILYRLQNYRLQKVSSVEYSYSITIDSNQSNFIVNVPFPLNEDGDYFASLYNAIIIKEGSCSYLINKSELGYSLQIVGNSSVKLDAIFKKEGVIDENINHSNMLSLTDYSRYIELDEDHNFGNVGRNASFYSQYNNTLIDFNFKYRDGFHRGVFLKTFWGGFGEYKYNGNLSSGWNQYIIDAVECEA